MIYVIPLLLIPESTVTAGKVLSFFPVYNAYQTQRLQVEDLSCTFGVSDTADCLFLYSCFQNDDFATCLE